MTDFSRLQRKMIGKSKKLFSFYGYLMSAALAVLILIVSASDWLAGPSAAGVYLGRAEAPVESPFWVLRLIAWFVIGFATCSFLLFGWSMIAYFRNVYRFLWIEKEFHRILVREETKPSKAATTHEDLRRVSVEPADIYDDSDIDIPEFLRRQKGKQAESKGEDD